MTTKEWSHLPNAEHIDWVLETLEKNPEMWDIAWGALWDVAWAAARAAACDASWDAARDDAWAAARAAVWAAARGAACDAVWDAARGAVAALVAWDDSSKLLDKSVEEVTELANEGNHAAVLLLPAVIVKNKLKEKNT